MGTVKLFVLVVMPIVEIVTAVLVARWIGLGWTILALIALSAIGVWQIKVQGLAAWRTARGDLVAGSSPAPAVLDGGLRFVGAVLLALPGFVSAVVGLVFLIGPIRNRASRTTGAWVVRRFRMPFVVVSDDRATGWAFTSSRRARTVDVEGWEEPLADPDRPALAPGDRDES